MSILNARLFINFQAIYTYFSFNAKKTVSKRKTGAKHSNIRITK